MPDEPQPPDPPAASASIRDSTISDSTVHLTSVDQRGQQVGTQYNAGGNITVNAATWQPHYEPPLAEAQDLLDALLAPDVPPISPLPSGARMPFAPNPHVVGRDAVLLALARALHGGARVAIGPKAAATGLGGIGKTSVAAEFVHRYGSFFAGGVFWLSFADPAAIASEVAACGGPGLLDLHPSYGDLKQDEQLALVRAAWQRPIPRLLIFDNAEDPQLVQQWAPPSGGCRILITSRRQSWPGKIVTHSLDVLARPASVALLRDLAPRLTPAEAEEIAEELGDFPLALQLAGSYLAQYPGIKVAAYLAELRSDVILAHPSLRGLHDGDVSTTAHDRHVGRTFLVSYQRLDPERDKLALALLARAACLAPGAPIPVDLLLASAELEPEDSSGQLALGRLVDLGFVTVGDEGVVLHRLVHAFVGAVVQDSGALAAIEWELCRQMHDRNMRGYVVDIPPLIVHLRWAVRAIDERVDNAMATLATNLAYHLNGNGDYLEARRYYESALAIRETIFGPNHPDTAISLNNLAATIKSLGNYSVAQHYYERALVIREKILGPNHPDTAISLNNLALLLYDVGRYQEAKILLERALGIQELVLEQNHPDKIATLNNLAFLLQDMELYHEASKIYERVLPIIELTHGFNHPSMVVTLNNLALLLQATGDFSKAKLLHERALDIIDTIGRTNHSSKGIVLISLSALYQATKQYDLARIPAEQALNIIEAEYGTDHPSTASTLNILARLLQATGRMEEAQALMARALRIRETVLGLKHPSTAESLNNLAALFQETGDHGKAYSHYQRALAICEQALGLDHPNTKMVRANYEILLSKMKDTP